MRICQPTIVDLTQELNEASGEQQAPQQPALPQNLLSFVKAQGEENQLDDGLVQSETPAVTVTSGGPTNIETEVNFEKQPAKNVLLEDSKPREPGQVDDETREVFEKQVSQEQLLLAEGASLRKSSRLRLSTDKEAAIKSGEESEDPNLAEWKCGPACNTVSGKDSLSHEPVKHLSGVPSKAELTVKIGNGKVSKASEIFPFLDSSAQSE